MSDHYYTPQPTSASQRKKIEATIRNETMQFYTDASVFSRSGVDFGSRLLIETMELPPSGRILDLGCGYGAIGLFAAKLDESVSVTLADLNERALALARDNAALNGLDNVDVLRSDVYDGVGDARFDCILCNPPIRAGKKIVHRIFAEAPARLRDGGALWIVIQKKQGAPSARKKLESCFQHVEEMARKSGYHIFCAR